MIAGCNDNGSPSGLPTVKMQLGGKTFTLEVAATYEARQTGLMKRDSMPDDHGMIFVFAYEQPLGFWMKNTLIPLSIAFIDDDWVIVDTKDMKVAPSPANGPFNIYESAKPFKYALEVNRGYFRTKGIGAGAKVRFELKSSKR